MLTIATEDSDHGYDAEMTLVTVDKRHRLCQMGDKISSNDV
jgi:hypothetical protein